MTEVYSNRTHSDIPKRVRSRISANVESVIEKLGDNPDHQEEMIEDLIDIAYDAYHVGWQSGFIDDSQPDPTEAQLVMHQRDESIMEALEKLKRTIDNNRMVFNYGGSK
jgi:hypothetical protein